MPWGIDPRKCMASWPGTSCQSCMYTESRFPTLVGARLYSQRTHISLFPRQELSFTMPYFTLLVQFGIDYSGIAGLHVAWSPNAFQYFSFTVWYCFHDTRYAIFILLVLVSLSRQNDENIWICTKLCEAFRISSVAWNALLAVSNQYALIARSWAIALLTTKLL